MIRKRKYMKFKKLKAIRFVKLAFIVPLTTIFATCFVGCGGGGGGGGGGVSNVSPTPIQVSSAAIGAAPTGTDKFGTAPSPAAVIAAANAGSALTAGKAAGLAGMSISFPLNFDNLTNTGVTGAVSIDPSFTLTTTGASVAGGITNLTGIGINTANATTIGNSLSFNNSDPANTFVTNGTSSASGHNTATATSYYDILVISLIPSGYQYTQYGDWSQCSANCSANGGTNSVNGVYVWGSATAPGNIPIAGTFTYNGNIEGNYLSAVGTKATVSGTQGTTGNMAATVNYATRSIAFSTSNSQFNAGAVAAPNLNISGTLTYAPGQNLFAGTVTSATMTGTASGRFYGPNAEEIGGIYSLSGGGAGHYGAFFGK